MKKTLSLIFSVSIIIFYSCKKDLYPLKATDSNKIEFIEPSSLTGTKITGTPIIKKLWFNEGQKVNKLASEESSLLSLNALPTTGPESPAEISFSTNVLIDEGRVRPAQPLTADIIKNFFADTTQATYFEWGLYVETPWPVVRDNVSMYITGDAKIHLGHSFLSLSTTDADGTVRRLSVGFYPSGNDRMGKVYSPGYMYNNEAHRYNVKYLFSGTGVNYKLGFQKIVDMLQKTEQQPSAPFDYSGQFVLYDTPYAWRLNPNSKYKYSHNDASRVLKLFAQARILPAVYSPSVNFPYGSLQSPYFFTAEFNGRLANQLDSARRFPTSNYGQNYLNVQGIDPNYQTFFWNTLISTNPDYQYSVIGSNINITSTPSLTAITKSNGMTQTQNNVLNSTLTSQLNLSCYYGNVYSGLINKSVKFNFNVNTSTAGAYNYTNNNLYFQSINTITANVLTEELFHAYQHYFYPGGGLAQYTNVGRSNIEFEAKLAFDISQAIEGGGCCLAISNDTEYLNWIYDLVNISAVDPTYPTSATVEAKYYHFLQKFIIAKPQYNFPINYSLKPLAYYSIADQCR
ncbi:hypothetical protein [Pedobacter frigoris]|uniref:Uncharacterized protein n=1 Tax=Pedobacter frigoris TaxID=2571272 RepID=A0A4U1CPX8_9SPHI|nr:hypothetical protein [Pedobacter frigoris]TKC07484.1 hypothetical protein FA047_09565 [Pedobacter frigoris]